jgi:hypothetical protein
MNVLVGARYLSLDQELDLRLSGPLPPTLPTAHLSESGHVWDGIVGVRGRFGLGESSWYVPYHLDLGAGDSEFTWQALAGIGYRWDWGNLVVVYRHLDFEEEGRAFEDLSFGGPALGVQFRF